MCLIKVWSPGSGEVAEVSASMWQIASSVWRERLVRQFWQQHDFQTLVAVIKSCGSWRASPEGVGLTQELTQTAGSCRDENNSTTTNGICRNLKGVQHAHPVWLQIILKQSVLPLATISSFPLLVFGCLHDIFKVGTPGKLNWTSILDNEMRPVSSQFT